MKSICLLILVFLLQACFFLRSPSKRLADVAQVGGVDVIIVPGLPLKDGRWDSLLQARVLWSEFLLRKNLTHHVIYSGNAVHTPWIESVGMSLYAKELGVATDRIHLDTLAEHSTENLFYGYRLAKEKGFEKIGFASDPFQCAMLNKFAKKNFEEKIYFLPVIYDSIRPGLRRAVKIDTSLARKKKFVALKEREDARERLKGTRGKKIEPK